MSASGERAFALLEEMNYIRVAGSDGERRGAGTIERALAEIKVRHHVDEFPIQDYDVQKARFAITAPFVMEAEATGYGFSGNTLEEGIRAPFLYAEDGDDITLAGARGKIVLLNAHPSAKIYEKLVNAGVAGFVTISGLPIDEREKTDLEMRSLRHTRHLKNGELPKICGVTIRASDALDLLRKEPTEAHLTLLQTEKEIHSRNIVAEIPGTDKADEWLTFTAHHDSVPFSAGMYDNAAGSAILLEACRYFAAHPTRRSLRFIWCGAEERGLLGSLWHVANRAEELPSTQLVINVDLAGQVIGGHHAVVTAEKSACTLMRFFAQEIGFGLTVRQDIFSSDSSPFADAGVPAVSFYRSGTSGHNRYDIIDLCSPESLQKSIEFLTHFCGRLANSQVFPVPRGIPEDLKEKLAVYFGRKEET